MGKGQRNRAARQRRRDIASAVAKIVTEAGIDDAVKMSWCVSAVADAVDKIGVSSGDERWGATLARVRMLFAYHAEEISHLYADDARLLERWFLDRLKEGAKR